MKRTVTLQLGGQRRRGNDLLNQYASRLGVFVRRRHTETSLIIARREAERANHVKSEFLANMSHELRTPLNAILGFSDILRQNGITAHDMEKVREYAGDIHTSGHYLLTLINEILDLAKVEAGRVELSLTEIDLGALAETSIRMVRERAAATNISIVKSVGANLPALLADQLRLKQVLLNLLTNAIKFTPEGGEVTLEIERGHADELTIAVADTGVGMKADEIPKALSPFGQLQHALSNKAEGTGLGLPLAKSYTELMNGTLFIQSQPGLGTRVVLKFPKSSCRPRPSADRHAPESGKQM